MFKITAPEDQTKFIVPLNRDTEKLYYGQRLIIDAKVLTEPRTWRITKVNRSVNLGVVMITYAQDQFNPEADYVEVKDGVVVGMWADYYPVTDKESPALEDIKAVVEYMAPNRKLRINGAARAFKVTYYRDGDIDTETISKPEWWTFEVTDEEEKVDAINLIETEFTDNQVTVKFVGGQKYIGDTLTVRNKDGECTVEIVST